MSKKLTRVLAVILTLSMTFSIAGCSNIEEFFDLGSSDSRHERRRDRDDDDDTDETEETEETEPGTSESFTVTEPTETTAPSSGELADLTYPDHVATYEEIHPAHPNGTVSGEEAVEILNDIEYELLSDMFRTTYVYTSIYFDDPSVIGVSFDQDNIGWGDVDEDHYEDIEEIMEILDDLYSIDRDSLSMDDKIFYDKLLYDMELEAYALQYTAFDYYESVLKPLTGPQSEVLFILEVLDFETVEDAENYILVLRDIDRFYDALCAFEERRADYGFINSDDVYEEVAESFDNLVAQSEDCFLYESFRERLNHIPGLSNAERDALIEEHDEVMHTIVFPEFQECADRMRALKCGASDVGVASYPGGDAYYAYIFATQTNSGRTIDESLEQLEAYTDSLMDQMYSVAASGNSDWIDEYMNHNYSEGDAADNLEFLYEEVQADFPPVPDHQYRFMTVPEVFQDSFSPAAFLGYHLDRFDSNIVITNEASIGDKFGIICAHEGYPGHMYESVYHRGITNHPYMYLMNSIGYSEGWATYTEVYSFKYFSTSAASSIVRIEDQLNSILYARFDIGVNYEGWTAQDCANWYGSLVGSVVRASDIQDAYTLLLSDPGYGVKYGIGFINTGMVMQQLHNEFPDASDLEIHTAYLNAGTGTFEQILEFAREFLAAGDPVFPVSSWGDPYSGNPFGGGSALPVDHHSGSGDGDDEPDETEPSETTSSGSLFGH